MMTEPGGNKRKQKVIYCGWDHETYVAATKPDFDWSPFPTSELLALRLVDGVDGFQDALRSELAKRPHIRTKAEAKVERQKKAKEKRNR